MLALRGLDLPRGLAFERYCPTGTQSLGVVGSIEFDDGVSEQAPKMAKQGSIRQVLKEGVDKRIIQLKEDQ